MKRWVASLATTLAAPLTARGSPAAVATTTHAVTARTMQQSILKFSPRSEFALASSTSRVSPFLVRCLSTRGGSGTKETTAASIPAYETLSNPAPGSPFHHAFPVHDLELAKNFYGNVLGCKEGRSSEKWQDYSLHGHQIVCHWVGNDYRCQDYYNPVDGDEVPVPHFGLALTVEQFHELAERLRKAGVEFIIEPHLRFKGMPGEQVSVG